MTPAGSRRKALLIQVATNAGVLIAWELLSRFVIPPQFLPPPSMIALAFVTTIRSGELPRQLWQTTSVLLLGFGLAIVTGMAIGIAMGMFKTLRRILDPYVNARFTPCPRWRWFRWSSSGWGSDSKPRCFSPGWFRCFPSSSMRRSAS
jgi:ABC-type nitrate/sulfonate/bicarbonate transport system permease component